MTRDSAKKNLEVIKAFAEGKEVQFKNIDGQWITAECPSYFDSVEYRIKPEQEDATTKNSSE